MKKIKKTIHLKKKNTFIKNLFQKENKKMQKKPLNQKSKSFFNIKVSLFLYTFDTKHSLMNIKALDTIFFLFKRKNLLEYKKIGQPARKKHLTLLRSPHIDKKSREQYSQSYQKVLFELEFYNSKVLQLFYSQLQKYAFRGAGLFFEWNTHDYLFPDKKFSKIPTFST